MSAVEILRASFSLAHSWPMRRLSANRRAAIAGRYSGVASATSVRMVSCQ
jgi:hypothetical protein